MNSGLLAYAGGIVLFLTGTTVVLAACAVLWYRVLLPALLRGDDAIADAVDVMSAATTSRRTSR